MSDCLFNPSFLDESILRENMVILDEIAKKADNPLSAIEDDIFSESYSTHPYSLPEEGNPSVINLLTRGKIFEHYKKLYHPSNIALVLVGDLKHEDALKLAKEYFGKDDPLKLQSNIAINSPVIIPIEKQIKTELPGSYISFGFLGPDSTKYKDVCAVDALVSYLGMGYGSWINSELRDKQKIVFGGNADFLTQKQPGLININASTSNPEKTISAIKQKIKRYTRKWDI